MNASYSPLAIRCKLNPDKNSKDFEVTLAASGVTYSPDLSLPPIGYIVAIDRVR